MSTTKGPVEPLDVKAELEALSSLAEQASRLGEARRASVSAEQRRIACVEALSTMTLSEASRRLG